MFEHVSMNHCTYFPIFQAKFKDVMGSSRLFHVPPRRFQSEIKLSVNEFTLLLY